MLTSSLWDDEELTLLGDSVAKVLTREFLPHAAAWERNGAVDRDAWKKAGAAGILCAGVPIEYGGAGGTHAHEIVIQQEILRAGLGGGFGVGNTIHSGIVAHYILSYGTEEQKLRWLPLMARGEKIAAIAMTEPESGSDLQNIRTLAVPTEGGWRLSGQKTFISNGQNCDLVIVVARTGAPGAKGISLLVVDSDAEGFRRGRNLDKIGMHAQDTSELFFDDVFVPAANLLGVEGQGFAQLMNQLAWERLIIALDAVVNMERAVALTTEYTRNRKVFGQRLIDFQNTQFVLADCATQATVARGFIDGLIVRLLADELDPVTAAKAKLWCTETQCKVVDACQQLFGGYGYMAEYPIARMFADARVGRIYGGANEVMKLIIARSL